MTTTNTTTTTITTLTTVDVTPDMFDNEIEHDWHVRAATVAYQTPSMMPASDIPIMTRAEAAMWLLLILVGALAFVAGVFTHLFILYIAGFVAALVGLVAFMFGVLHLIESRAK